MFNLSHSDTRPIYEQIKDKIKRLILTGAMSTDSRLPSVRELAASLAINPNTIQRAYKELEAEGYVYSIKAKGSFVAPINQSTLQKQQASLFTELDKTLQKLCLSGVTENELIEHIGKFYNKEEKPL